jgi:hypothetical protein
MSELTPEMAERLKGAAYNGDVVRDLCKHPGFKVYLSALEAIISDNKNTWLNGTDEDAKNARFEARGVQRAINELKKFMLSGDNAKRMLTDAATPDLSGPTYSGQAS